MIPGWKLKRELERLRQQFQIIPEAIWEPFARRKHDIALARRFKITEGEIPLNSKVAIVLCWQPNGLANSFFMTLKHLISNGYAPFVVSNAPVSEIDMLSLQSRVWRVMERPNFGYDFGGYRDGLLVLRSDGIKTDRLIIMNDSVWFPIWPNDQLIERAEAAPFDVVGTILREKGKIAFLESYFFSIRGSVLDQPEFCHFWDSIRLTSNKYKVIRRGERGFGKALNDAGISMGALFPPDVFKNMISKTDDLNIREILNYMSVVDPKLNIEAQILATGKGSNWRLTVDKFIASVLEKLQPYSTFPILSAGHLNYPVLKKSGEPVSLIWRETFLRAVLDGALPPPLPEVLTELQLSSQSNHGLQITKK